MPIYKDTEDDGSSPLAAFEYRTKLKSRQAMWQAAGMAANDVNATVTHFQDLTFRYV